MKVTDYASRLAKLNKGKRGHDVSVGQVSELLKQMNKDCDGWLYTCIKEGVFGEWKKGKGK